MSKLRTAFIWIIFLFFSFSALLIVAGFVFEDDIKRLFINELNKNLNAEVLVKKEDIKLDLLRSFPSASINFNHIRIRESIENSDYFFADLEKLSLRFNPFDLFNKNYEVKAIDLRGGYIQMRTLKNGMQNFKVWKNPDPSKSNSDPVRISLNKIILEDVEFRYHDERVNIIIDQQIEYGLGKLTSSGKGLSIDADLALYSEIVQVKGNKFLKDVQFNINTILHIPFDDPVLNFDHLDLKVNNSLISAKGDIGIGKDPIINLNLNSNRSDLTTLMSLLPPRVFPGLRDYESSGLMEFSGMVSGSLKNGRSPAMDFSFSLENGSLKHQEFDAKLKKLQFEGEFISDPVKKTESYINIKNFSAEEGGKPINLNFTYSNFSDPKIELDLNGTISLGSLFLFLPNDYIKQPKGMVVLEHISVAGKLSEFNKPYLAAKKLASGAITMQEISFRTPEEKVENIEGKLILEGNSLLIEQLSITTESSDLKLDGSARNFVPFLFPEPGKSPPKMILEANLISENFDAKKFWLTSIRPSTEGEEEKTENDLPTAEIKEDEPVNLMSGIKGNINLVIDNFQYGKFQIEKFRGDAVLTTGLLEIRELTGSSMDGKVSLKAFMREMPNGTKVLEVSGILNSIRIEQLFDQFEDFGQETLQSRHLEGALSGDIHNLTMVWSPQLEFLSKKLYLDADVSIESGQLKGFEALESLSKFIAIEELREIQFSKLSNRIRIEEDIITIPMMEIRSSALNLKLAGSSSFDQQIDFMVKVSVADILAGKLRKNKKRKFSENDEFEEGLDGGMNIYVAMKGKSSDPDITLNKKTVKRRFKEAEDTGIPDPDIINISNEEKPQNPNLIDWDQDVEGELEFIEWEDEDEDN